MIRVSVMYPNETGKRFDMAYYIDKHIAAVNKSMSGLGLVRCEVDKGIGSVQPGAPAPFAVMAHMYFECMEDMQRCMANSSDLMADLPNFTDIQPQIQISEVI